MNNLHVSVCVASFNGEKFIIEQLNSIYVSLKLAQVSCFEIIVSDDGSSDRTLELLTAFRGPNLSIVMGPRKGINKNFESMILKSKGDTIFLCDQDDVWLPDRVSRALRLRADQNLVIAEANVVDDKLNGTDVYSNLVPRSKGLIKNVYRNGFTGAFMAGPKDLFKKAIPFPESRKVMYDWWVGLITIIEGYDVVFDDTPTIKYRRHTGNQTLVRSSTRISKYAIISRLLLITCLLKYCGKRILRF